MLPGASDAVLAALDIYSIVADKVGKSVPSKLRVLTTASTDLFRFFEDFAVEEDPELSPESKSKGSVVAGNSSAYFCASSKVCRRMVMNFLSESICAAFETGML